MLIMLISCVNYFKYTITFAKKKLKDRVFKAVLCVSIWYNVY